MIPTILSYDCSDHDPIDLWVPNDPRDVNYWVTFTIGLNSGDGGDNFQLRVATPKNLHLEDSHASTIVVNTYSWETVLIEVEKILEKCAGKDWDEISNKLAKYMDWEFEDYKPYTESK